MFRTSTLATLSVLAFSGCITTPASAQYLYGNLHGDYAHGDSDSHHDHGHGCHCDSCHQYHRGYSDYQRFGHVAYPNTVLSRHRTTPNYDEASCPYGNDSVCREPIGCSLWHGRTSPNRLPDQYQPGFGSGAPSHNHSISADSHSGHSHDGHSHERNSHEPQFPSRDVAPSDRGYLAPPLLPRDSVRGRQPQQDFRRGQPQRDDSLRMDSPPPSMFSPSSPATSQGTSPKQFNTPPPPTL